MESKAQFLFWSESLINNVAFYNTGQICFIMVYEIMYCIQKWLIQGNKTTIFETIGNNNFNLMLFLDMGGIFFPLNKQVCGFEGSCSSFFVENA